MTRGPAEELVDPDAGDEVGDTASRDGWFPRPRTIGLVFLGGALGVAARTMLMLVVADDTIGVLAANLSGALLLGLLLELVPARTSELRALLGTGLLGGFTTYSALAVDSVLLGPAVGTGYVVASVLGGLLAAGLGVALGRRLQRFGPHVQRLGRR